MARGFSVAFDALTQTVDGTPLDQIWNEFTAALALHNSQRTAFDSLLTFRTTLAHDEVIQAADDDDGFEPQSEFGIPKSIRQAAEPLSLGYALNWFDSAIRYTWQFLRDAPANQVTAQHSKALSQDNKLVHRAILKQLFTASSGTNKEGNTVYGLYNGDGMVPPPFEGNTFTGDHTHLFTTGSTALDGTDLADLLDKVTEHGYGVDPGTRMLILANAQEARTIRKLRADDANGTYDFIPSAGAPSYLTQEHIVGNLAPAEYEGLKVIGSFGDALVSENYLVPKGYVIALASGAANAPSNPIGFREHPNAGMQGLLMPGGTSSKYPLIDATYVHGFGVGVRHRGAAAVLQVSTDSDYTAPTI